MNSRATGPRRASFATTDPEEAASYLVSAFGPVRMSGLRRGDRFRHARIDAGAFCLDHAQLPGRLRFDLEPLGVVLVSTMAGGRAERWSHGELVRFGPTDVFICADPDAGARVSTSALDDNFGTVLGLSLLAQVASAESTRRAVPIRFTGLEATSAVLARQWRSTYSYVDLTLSDPDVAGQPLVVGTAGRLLAAAALATFPNTALLDPTAMDRRDSGAPTLRRAVNYIETHAADDLSVADIASAAAVTIRAVQLAFRRHLGTTPMAYLRQVRLAHAHQELLRADPGSRTVAEIAARWGFANHSRFTASYRRTYGVPPSHTLKRG